MSVAKRRLGFLKKEGFDRFGNNKLFAPRIKWEALKEEVKGIRDHATAYENAYNDIQRSVEQQEGISSIRQALPDAAVLQIRAEKQRLEEAKTISESEKRAYVSVSFCHFFSLLFPHCVPSLRFFLRLTLFLHHYEQMKLDRQIAFLTFKSRALLLETLFTSWTSSDDCFWVDRMLCPGLTPRCVVWTSAILTPRGGRGWGWIHPYVSWGVPPVTLRHSARQFIAFRVLFLEKDDTTEIHILCHCMSLVSVRLHGNVTHWKSR